MPKCEPRVIKIDDFSFVRHVLPLHALCGKAYSTRFRKNPGSVFVEFESGGKWYRCELTQHDDCQKVVGVVWLRAHHAAITERLARRRAKYKKKGKR